jgi:hypothetical protein
MAKKILYFKPGTFRLGVSTFPALAEDDNTMDDIPENLPGRIKDGKIYALRRDLGDR